MPRPQRLEVEVDGRRLSLSNLDKVLYPAAGFTKGQVIDYYTRIAPVAAAAPARPAADAQALSRTASRASSSTRSSAPSTGRTGCARRRSSARQRRTIDFCLCDDLPTLVWLANLADLELHTSLALAADPQRPTMLAFDLDPGPPATIVECAEVALRLRELVRPARPRRLPEDVRLEGHAGLRAAQHADVELRRNQAVRAGARPAARARGPRSRRLGDEEVPAHGQGARRLEPERRAQDDRRRVLAARPERPTVSTPLRWEEVEAVPSRAIPTRSCSRRTRCWSASPSTATCSPPWRARAGAPRHSPDRGKRSRNGRERPT